MATTSIKNIAQAIYESSKDKTGNELSLVMKNVVAMLNKKHLLIKAPDILKKLEEIADEDKGILKIHITSATHLHNKDIEEIESVLKKRYKAKHIETTKEEDKTLLGGIKIKVKDEIINLTLRNRLNKLQTYLTKN